MRIVDPKEFNAVLNPMSHHAQHFVIETGGIVPTVVTVATVVAGVVVMAVIVVAAAADGATNPPLIKNKFNHGHHPFDRFRIGSKRSRRIYSNQSYLRYLQAIFFSL